MVQVCIEVTLEHSGLITGAGLSLRGVGQPDLRGEPGEGRSPVSQLPTGEAMQVALVAE